MPMIGTPINLPTTHPVARIPSMLWDEIGTKWFADRPDEFQRLLDSNDDGLRAALIEMDRQRRTKPIDLPAFRKAFARLKATIDQVVSEPVSTKVK